MTQTFDSMRTQFEKYSVNKLLFERFNPNNPFNTLLIPTANHFSVIWSTTQDQGLKDKFGFAKTPCYLTQAHGTGWSAVLGGAFIAHYSFCVFSLRRFPWKDPPIPHMALLF